MSKQAIDTFNRAWNTNVGKLKNPSKDTQAILDALKASILELIPALVSDIIENKEEIKGCADKVRSLTESNNGLTNKIQKLETFDKTGESDDPRDAFSTKYACNQEVKRVQNTLIVEFRQGHEFGKGKNLPGPDFIKDINNEMSNLRDKQDKKPADLKAADMTWTKIATPKAGAHADSTHYRLLMNRKFSKKALFIMLKSLGQTKYASISIRNETPGFLRQAKHGADHVAAMIRAQTNKILRTRVIFNPKRQTMDLQTATKDNDGMTYTTIASSDPDPGNPDILKIPTGDLARGQEEVEVILRNLDGYNPITES